MGADAERPNTHRSILFVCTGNTCRSPLAEALCKRLLADRVGCSVADLPARGYVVRSAGVAAFPGDAPSDLSVVVAAEHGAELAAHRSRPVNPELLAAATDVITMTQAHATVLGVRYPGVGPAPRLLCGPGDDLPDPIGGDLEVYRMCAAIIRDRLEQVLPAWVPPAPGA